MTVAEMTLTGEMLIGGRTVRGSESVTRAVQPQLRVQELEPAFGGGTQADVDAACELAEAAFNPYRAVSLEERAKFLETIAQGILDLGDVLVERVMSESGLPRPRVEGERGRTVGQLRLFASLAREGRWLTATLDRAMPDRKPLPRADLRMQKIPVGPVAVFSASNFPLAFSVAGGDTAAAFAAGCPVVAKAHSSHPGTSELVGRVIQKAVAECGLPEGTFSLLVGGGSTVGEALVQHPAIPGGGVHRVHGASGGTWLRWPPHARCPSRCTREYEQHQPGVSAARCAAGGTGREDFAQGLIDSVTLGMGQFCTKPGIVMGVKGPDFDRFVAAAEDAVAKKAATTMLNSGIHRAYCQGASDWGKDSGVRTLSAGGAPPS